MSSILEISNQWQLWVVCSILIAVIIVQAALFVRLCRKEAAFIGYPKKKLNAAVVSGMITSIGPALANIVVMISMIAVLGGPITWQKLADIGSAQTELTTVNAATSVMGVELGSADFNLAALTFCFFLMAFNGCAWLVVTALFTPTMDKVRLKLSGGDSTWLILLSAGTTIGLFSNFTAQRLLTGRGPFAAVVVGFTSQYIIDNVIAVRYPKIKSYALAISLILGILVGYLVQPV
jgi:hypothetical protein